MPVVAFSFDFSQLHHNDDYSQGVHYTKALRFYCHGFSASCEPTCQVSWSISYPDFQHSPTSKIGKTLPYDSGMNIPNVIWVAKHRFLSVWPTRLWTLTYTLICRMLWLQDSSLDMSALVISHYYLTDFICSESTLMLELILIPITICNHALRFTTQVW